MTPEGGLDKGGLDKGGLAHVRGRRDCAMLATAIQDTAPISVKRSLMRVHWSEAETFDGEDVAV